MKYLIPAVLTTLIATYATTTLAATKDMETRRLQVIKQYIHDLGAADYEHITSLFTEKGEVISTSQGKVEARDFFYSFLPEIDSATTEIHHYFTDDQGGNHYAARFHFKYKMHDGETGEGEYIDEFIFANGSAKLSGVYMFENLKFPQSPSLY